MIWSSMEYVIGYTRDILNVDAMTYVPKNTPNAFALVDRTGGEMDYPHDRPEFSVSIWAKRADVCEELAHKLAIGLKTKPPEDIHINSHSTPVVFSYGRDESGFFVWQITFGLVTNILDEE